MRDHALHVKTQGSFALRRVSALHAVSFHRQLSNHIAKRGNAKVRYSTNPTPPTGSDPRTSLETSSASTLALTSSHMRNRL